MLTEPGGIHIGSSLIGCLFRYSYGNKIIIKMTLYTEWGEEDVMDALFIPVEETIIRSCHANQFRFLTAVPVVLRFVGG